MQLKAALFDLYGTLCYVKIPFTDEATSEFLVKRGYQVYPQSWKAAWQYVSFLDYPKSGYGDWESYLTQVFKRARIRPDGKTLKELAGRYEGSKWVLYSDAKTATSRAKQAGLKSAIITTIARFKYMRILKPLLKNFDLIVDGYTFRCEKSNPAIYSKTLERLGLKPGEALMIGDDVALDILLPRSIGIDAILLDRTGRLRAEDCKEAVAVAKNLNEAMDMVISRFG